MPRKDPKEAIEYRNRKDVKARKAEINHDRWERIKKDPVLLEEYRKYKAEWRRNKRKTNPKFRRQENNNHKKYNWERKLIVINHYLGICVCCGEKQMEFLSINHKNNNGAEHRRKIGQGNLYQWIINNNFPSDYEVMCMNCNSSNGFYGFCPHGGKKHE
jgi:hypothetical protein